MKLSETELDANRIRIDVVACAEEVNAAFTQVEKRTEGIPSEDLAPYVAEHLIPRVLDGAKILPAFPPHVNFDAEPRIGEDFSFAIELLPKPSYELSSYEPVSFSMPSIEIKDFEIDANLVQIADSYAIFVSEEPRPVVLGDSVMITMKAFDEGESVPELTIEERTYVTDSNMMPSGFDENLIGMVPGETKSFSIMGSLIDDEGTESIRKVDCTVHVLEIQKKVIPSVTDVWVKDNIEPFETVAQLREEIKDQLFSERTDGLDEMRRQLALAELCSRFEGDIPAEIQEENKNALLSNISMQLDVQGITLEWFMSQNGGEENFHAMVEAQTRQSLIEGYALDAFFRHKNMTLEEDDIIEACKTIDSDNPEAVKDQMEQGGYTFALHETASRVKANTWLVDNAQITAINE